MSCIRSRFDDAACSIRDNIDSKRYCCLPAIECLGKLVAALARLYWASLRMQYRLKVLLFSTAQDLNAKSMSLFPPLPKGCCVKIHQL